jgi:biotin carboxylase
MREDWAELYDIIPSNIVLEINLSCPNSNEVDIDLLVQNGEIKFYSISDNFEKSQGRFFLDRGQMMPSILPASNQEEMCAMVKDTIKKLEINDGCIHFEAKSTSHGPFPVEVNMRLGGDYVYSYNKGAWGVDLVENPVKIALGIPLEIVQPAQPYKYIIGWDLQPPFSGRLVEQEISPELTKQPFFEDMYLATEPGDEVMIPPDGYEDFGWITVSGSTAQEAKKNLQTALGMMRFTVIPSHT